MPAPRTHQPAKSKRARIYGVRRVDDERSHTHAWVLTVTRNRRVFKQYFSDGVYSGKRAALKAAIGYRDKILKDNAPLSRRQFVQVKRENNCSGVPGVCKSAKPRNRKGGRTVEWFWIASWTPQPGGARKHRSFSVKAHGGRSAFRHAVAARRKGLAEMEPGAHINHPGQVQPRGRGKAG